MHSDQASSSASNCRQQVYLLDRDAGLLCRILGLYASRGVEVTDVHYSYTAQGVMRLDVSVEHAQPDTAETVRVLVAKASNFVGVLTAAEQDSEGRSAGEH